MSPKFASYRRSLLAGDFSAMATGLVQNRLQAGSCCTWISATKFPGELLLRYAKNPRVSPARCAERSTIPNKNQSARKVASKPDFRAYRFRLKPDSRYLTTTTSPRAGISPSASLQ
jgi:hypothetical protein